MNALKLRRASATKKRAGIGRCSSPVPVALLPLKRVGRLDVVVATETRRSKRKWVKRTGKVLPNIVENFISDENGNPSMQCSTENPGVGETSEPNEETSPVSQMTLLHGTESICSNLESKTNMKTVETTPDTGLSVPTGVSSYLINCLDTVSMSESTELTSNLTIFSSPEVFRGEDESSGTSSLKTVMTTTVSKWLKYKNSTLLDSSNAVDIDVLPQLSNVSEIIDPSSKHLPGEHTERDRCVVKEASPFVHISTTVAGKHLYKMRHPRENTPTSTRRASPSLPAKPHKNLSNSNKIKKSRCKKKVVFSLPLDYRAPACTWGECSNAPTNASVREPYENVNTYSQAQCSEIVTEKDRALLTSTPFCNKEDLALDISPVHMPTLDEELVPNETGPFVCSSEIVATSSSLENSRQSKVPQSVMDISTRKAEFEGTSQNIEDKCQNIQQKREPKSYPICPLLTFMEKDVYPKPKVAPTYRPIPKGIPIGYKL
ncbi:meiosis-specific kinetochore protein isoform X2 [Pleurodeles waltl]|uniref:meiosis-specific kinetochore protein isoform X2 n=1 Tax=Pleurodeles waltl TaxID=8319 RepID=UPI0037097B8F